MTDSSSNPCRRWEGGDPGVANQKSPTCLLLTPDLRFHSFGFAARDFYHDLDPEEAQHWLYFDKFKMKIHSTSVREWDMRWNSSVKRPYFHDICRFKIRSNSDFMGHWLLITATRWRVTFPYLKKKDLTTVSLTASVGQLHAAVFQQLSLFLVQDLTMETELEAVNGRRVRAIEVFAHALRFFREHALKVQFKTLVSHSAVTMWWNTRWIQLRICVVAVLWGVYRLIFEGRRN